MSRYVYVLSIYHSRNGLEEWFRESLGDIAEIFDDWMLDREVSIKRCYISELSTLTSDDNEIIDKVETNDLIKVKNIDIAEIISDLRVRNFTLTTTDIDEIISIYIDNVLLAVPGRSFITYINDDDGISILYADEPDIDDDSLQMLPYGYDDECEPIDRPIYRYKYTQRYSFLGDKDTLSPVEMGEWELIPM